MVELLTWLASKISLPILRVLSMFGIGWAKKKLRETVKVEIDKSLDIIPDIIPDTDTFPAAWLKFKVRGISEVNLIPKKIVAWILVGGATIGEITWSKQDFIFVKSLGMEKYHIIPNILPAGQTQDESFQFYYPLPLYVDFGKNKLVINGVIEFDSIFGTVSKKFQVEGNLSEDMWENALDAWKKCYEGSKTLIGLINS
jgi:hypothetical protein